jgi:hypothetical protein
LTEKGLTGRPTPSIAIDYTLDKGSGGSGGSRF